MPKSYAQNLLFGFNQLHPEPPDLSIHAPSSFTLPGANFSDMPEPIPSTAASVSQASPDSFAATHTLSNAAFSPIASIPDQSPQQTRLSGLAAYVTQDLDPTAPLTSTHIFGSTPPFLNDHNSNMAVGRAVASSYGYTGDPALFLREKGRELGFTFPSDLANEFQLYAHIGESFSQSQRAHAQKRNTQIQARRPSDEEIEKYLPKALMKAVSGSPLNWLESSLLKRAGVQESTLRKVRYILQNGKLPGFHSGWRKSLNSRFNDLEIDELAQAVKDDPVARYILCELARKEGYNSRSQAHDNDGIKRFGKAQIEAFHNLKEPMVHAIKQVGSGIATAVDNILDGDVSLAMQDDNFIFSTTDEAEERNRRAFYHDFTSAFNAGYQQRTDELKNNLKDSWSFNVSQFLSSSGNVLGQTLPYFNGATALMAIGGMASDEMNKAASNALHNGSLYSASGWELYGAPSTKAAIFGASIAATGAMFNKGAALISNTAIGRYAADRIALSPLAGYASRFAEGAASEAVEELSNALGQEAFELTGLVQDHQKESHMSQFVETMTSPDFWGANVGMNLGFAAFGLHGSRSKAPYKALKDLKKLGFSTKEAWNIGLSVRQAARNGASPAAVSNIVADAIRVKQAAAPQEMQANLQAAAQSLLNQQLIEQAAASGVRDFLIKEANISDMQKTPEGKIKAKILTHNDAGELEAVEHEFTDSELNDCLLANLDSAITQEILNTQKLVRGEQLVQAADTLHSQQKSPFARIATMLDAPAELLAQLKGKDAFDEQSLALFAQYALNNVQSGSFGNIPVPASSVASVAADFSHRIRIARDKGEIAPDAAAESTAFIIPGKTPGDNVLMLARGQVSAKSLAHDWLEGFARSRYDADPDFWQATLDAVDRELLQNKVTQKSIFSKPEGQREHLDYIEAFSNLAESSWLANHDVLNVNDTAHALADEMLEDLGSVQAGIALAQELSRYLESDTAKQAIGQGLDPLRDILTQAGASLTDLVQEAENQSPQTAADFILQHRQRIQQELADLASQADAADSAPPVTQMESNAELQSTNITDTFFPDATPDSPPITVKDVAQLNGVDPALGTLSAPPPAAYASVTSPDGAGKGLNGGIAHRMRDGSIEGAAPVASLSLHKSLSHVNLSRAQGDTTAPVICHRSKDGSLHVIGGFARLVHEQLLGIPNTHVKVYPSSKKFDHRWATDRAAQEAIRAGIASTRDTLKYFIKHKLTRTQARKRNLIPSDAAGQELPSSRAAWLLLRHSPAKTVAQVSTGKLSLQDALSSIASQEPTKSYSANAKELAHLFDNDDSLLTQNAIITKPGASFSVQALHASPHLFYKFSTDHMGSGEGIQAFGWGLYFATRTGINKSYFSMFNKVKRIITKEYDDFLKDLREIGYDWGDSIDPSDNEDLVITIEGFIKQTSKLLEETQISLSAWERNVPRLFEDLRNNIKEELRKRPKGKFARFFFDYKKINEAISRYKKQIRHFNVYGEKTEREAKEQWNQYQKSKKRKIKELSSQLENLSRKLEKLQEFKDRARSIVISTLVGNRAFNYRVELNVEDSSLLDWDNTVNIPPEMYDFAFNGEDDYTDYTSLKSVFQEMKELGISADNNGKRPKVTGAQFYHALEEKFNGTFDLTSPDFGKGAKKASEWLLAHGYKGIKYLDGASRRAGKGTYNYVIFSGDDIKITAINQSGEWSMTKGWEEYNDPTASFSIQAKKGKRRYSSLADMVKNEQFFTLLDEAKRIERQAINFVNPEKELDSLLVQSSKLNGLLNAISQLLPKDARPWKTLPYIRERFQAFAGMAVNPHLPFNPNNQHAKAFTADEITRYNELDPKQRREFISRKLEYAYKSLTKSTARSLEAYLSRELMDSVERAIKTLQPKLQPSGKEKRGLTSASTFKKAMSFYNMMNMAPAEVSLRQLELNGILTNSDTSEQEIDNAERELKALALFGNLREASLEQTQNAVNVFMEFLETGKEAWEYKLAQERQAAEKIRTSLSKVQPRVKPSAVNAAQQRKQAGLTNLHAAGLDSFMNATQTLYALSAIPGDFGKTMKNTLEDLALAQDNCTAAINSYKQKADALLDAVLNIQDLPAIIRDAKRSAFLVDANQYKHPNIHREGTIRIHNYKFSKAQIDTLLDLQKTATTQELAEAIERHRTSSNVDQDLRFSASLAPRALRALNDAVTQTKEEHYQGGTVYVQIYGKRDADHIEKLDLTPLQAANLVLMAEQASYDNKYDEEGNLIDRGTMDINGYTPKVLYQLENYAGAKLMTWLRNLRELFNTTGLFEAYEEYTGLPFPREENYWPGVFESPKQGSMTDALDSAKNGAGTYQMLIKRRDHITPPDSSIPATASWESAITQHFTYIHLSPITRELRRITRNKDFQTRLAQIATPQLADNLVQLLDTIDGAPSVCLRAIKPLNRTFALTVGKHAANVLAGATASGFKNLTGILNGTAYQGINCFNLIPYTIKGFTHQHHITPAQLLKLPVFQNRLHRDSLTNDAAHLSPGDKQTALSFARLFGMRFFMEYPDLIANLTSMTAVYNHQFDTQLQALHQEYGKNYTPTQEDLAAIRQTCEKTVSSIMHMAAQPMEQNDKSAFLHTQNWAQNMTTYMKGEVLIKIGLARAQYLHTRLQAPNATGAAKTRNRLHAVWNFYSTLAKYSLAGQAAAVILTIASNGAPEDEDEFQNWLLTNTLAGLCGFGLISLIPIIGDTAAMVMQSIFGERGTFATYSTAGVGGLHPRNIRSIRKLIDPEQSEDISTGERWLALSDTSRFLGTTIGAFGGSSRPATIAAELFTGISALLNISRPYFQHLKNTAEKDAAAEREYQKHLRRQRAILRKLLKSSSGTAL